MRTEQVGMFWKNFAPCSGRTDLLPGALVNQVVGPESKGSPPWQTYLISPRTWEIQSPSHKIVSLPTRATTGAYCFPPPSNGGNRS